MNLGAFCAVAVVELHQGSDELSAFSGVGRRLPWVGLGLTLCLLSLAGLPPLGGFAGKTILFGAALGAGWTALAALMAANTALSLFFYLRVIQPMYLDSNATAVEGRSPRMLAFVVVLLAAGTLLIGVLPQPWIAWASQAGTMWIGPHS